MQKYMADRLHQSISLVDIRRETKKLVIHNGGFVQVKLTSRVGYFNTFEEAVNFLKTVHIDSIKAHKDALKAIEKMTDAEVLEIYEKKKGVR